jgi:Zn-dependent protease
VFRLPSIRVGRILGIPVEINVTWFAVLGLVGWSLASDYYPVEFPGRAVSVDVASGVITALAFFASLLAHEFSHSIVARRAGIPVERITLFLFGGVAQLAEEPRDPGVEMRMALAGPGASLLMGLGWFALFRLAVAVGLSDVVWAPLVTLATVNVVIAVFNLTPGFPMDGGRVLRALLWWATGDRRWSTRLASVLGQAIAGGIVLAGVWLALSGSLSGVWLMFVGVFVMTLASRAYATQLPRFRVAATPASELLTGPVATVAHDAPLSEVAELMLAGRDETLTAVVEAGCVTGVLDADSVARGLAADAAATAGSAAFAPDPASLIDAAESLETAARRSAALAGPFLVVREGRLAGQISRMRVGEALLKTGTERS